MELGEIEASLRKEARVDAAIAIGWPVTAGGADGVVAFIDDSTVDTVALLERLAKQLPSYMLPKRVVVVDSFPLNANGKIDRNALRALLS